MSCQTPKECNLHGDCINSICDCDVGYFEDDCSQNLLFEFPSAFFIFKILFSIVFLIMLFLSFQKLSYNIKYANVIH
jgi:hypothetical protein